MGQVSQSRIIEVKEKDLLERKRRLKKPRDAERRKGSLLLPHHAQGEKLRPSAPLCGRAQRHHTLPFSEGSKMRYRVSGTFHRVPGTQQSG